MNAYELADKLSNRRETLIYSSYIADAQHMLRQQADHIAELKSKVKSYENLGNMMLDELLEKAQQK
jgi:hypothetical protein